MKAGQSLLFTTILVAPVLSHELGSYPTGAGRAAVLIAWPPLFAVAVGIGILLSIRLARSRFAWLASATTVVLAAPRFFVYDITFLMTAVPDRSRTARDTAA
jgi:hypothetical protein